MIITIGTKPNKNGNSTKVTIDTEEKRLYTGYSARITIDIHASSSKEIKELIKSLKQDGYRETIKL